MYRSFFVSLCLRGSISCTNEPNFVSALIRSIRPNPRSILQGKKLKTDPLSAPSLWRHRDFLWLWGGQSVSLLGSQIGGTALQFVAILTLGASPVQLGWLTVANALPVLICGLLAGVWVDRLRRRPLLIAANLGRGLLLLTIPAAALLGVLGMGQLYWVAALVSLLGLFFDLAWPAYLPSLVKPEQLLEGNSKLSISESVAEIGGPGIGGLLVETLSPPLALLADAASFFISSLSLAAIRTPEPAPPPRDLRQHPVAQLMADVREGLAVAFGQPILRALLLSAATQSITNGIIGTLYALYMVGTLGISPLAVGLIVGVGGVSALGGAFLAEPLTRRYGIGRALIGSRLVGFVFNSLMVLAFGPHALVLVLLVLSQAADATWTIYAITETSLQQSITPNRLLGRLHASIRFITALLLPVGGLLGGYLGQTIGLRAAIGVGLLIGAAATLWLIFSPVRGMRGVGE